MPSREHFSQHSEGGKARRGSNGIIDMDLMHHGALHEIEEHSVGFSLAFIGIFTATFVFLAAVGATPDPTAKWNKEHGGAKIAAADTTQGSAQIAASPEDPVRIVIDSIGLDASISNPASSDIDVLDNALLTGAVRYPASAELGVDGAVLLFGHSSYLPVVHNQAYKAFDGIQNLRSGDEISVYSGTKEYRYHVTGVRMANVNDQDSATIPLPADGQHLTLVTCDSFATKSDRFVVNADLAGTYSLAQ